MSDLIERLRMLKEIAGIEGGCIGDAAADRIAGLEAEVSYLRTRDKSQGAYIEQVLDELEAENEEDRIAELEASRDRWKQQYELEEKETSALHDRIAELEKFDEDNREELRMADKYIKELEAQVVALQNKCARRGLSPEDSDALQAENERLRVLLKVAQCPNQHCDGEGTCAGEVPGYDGEGDLDVWQCQWCAERKALLGEPE